MKKTSAKSDTPRPAFLEAVVGLAADFWFDGPTPPFFAQMTAKAKKIFVFQKKDREEGDEGGGDTKSKKKRAGAKKAELWDGSRCEVIEAMWGEGYFLPGGDTFIDLMTVPLGLTKEMNVLDMSAGLGSIGRHLSETHKIYTTGLEPDEELAECGMAISRAKDKVAQVGISSYDPSFFTAEKRYHCVLARELIYRVAKKEIFFTELAKSLLPNTALRGQVAFTDYLLEDKDRKKPAIVAWLAAEKEAKPASEDVLRKILKKNGLDVRVAEDLTARYRQEIFRGFANLGAFLQTHKPTPETKLFILKEMQLWSARVAAMKHGLRFCRFYAIKG